MENVSRRGNDFNCEAVFIDNFPSNSNPVDGDILIHASANEPCLGLEGETGKLDRDTNSIPVCENPFPSRVEQLIDPPLISSHQSNCIWDPSMRYGGEALMLHSYAISVASDADPLDGLSADITCTSEPLMDPSLLPPDSSNCILATLEPPLVPSDPSNFIADPSVSHEEEAPVLCSNTTSVASDANPVDGLRADITCVIEPLMDPSLLPTVSSNFFPATLDPDLVSSDPSNFILDRSVSHEEEAPVLCSNTISVASDASPVDGLRGDYTCVSEPSVDLSLLPPGSSNCFLATLDEEFLDETDFSDVVLKYINEILMEEETESETCIFQGSNLALQDTEKSFYDILGENYPPQPDSELKYFDSHNGNFNGIETNRYDSCCNENENVPLLHPSSSNPHSSFSLACENFNDAGLTVVPDYRLRLHDDLDENEIVLHSRGRVAGALLLPPNGCYSRFLISTNSGLLREEPSGESVRVTGAVDGLENECPMNGSRGRKNPNFEDLDSDCGRITKHLAVYAESTLEQGILDQMLLHKNEECDSALRDTLQNRMSNNLQNKTQANRGKNRQMKRGEKKELVDWRSLLTNCAHAIATENRTNADELLKQIKRHSSPIGDAMERLGSYFSNAFESRLLGTGTESYKGLLAKPLAATVNLKCCYLINSVCPFMKFFYFFSNKTIMHAAKGVTKLHIISFGIYYGFQWPSLIEQLSSRRGGPPKLRITGIDFPQPGKRPAQGIEESGRRLANYAKRFNVPFEFNAIVQKWETIRPEDIKIESDEVVVVNAAMKFRNLLDETVVLESPRNTVLNLIRMLNPAVLIKMEENAGLNSPFFLTRFQESLFFFSAMFDMLDSVVPRETPERVVTEERFGREIMNVIACEGSERIERPETFKQWMVRMQRAGFRQLHFNKDLFWIAKDRMAPFYHKDFLLDEDGPWILLGWKGRVTHTFSCWRLAH